MQEDYPRAVELRKLQERQPLPFIPPGTVDPGCMDGDEPTKQALDTLSIFNAALATDDAEGLAGCFYSDQAYWRDQLALT